MTVIERTTIYICPSCGRQHLDRYDTRDPRCPHRGDHFEAVEMVPAEQLRGAVAECDAAKACFALVISDIASSEAQAYELGKRYMERALRAVGGGKA